MRSPLVACYKPWREICLAEDYEIVGVSKNITGLPVLYAPKEDFALASKDPNGPEAKSLQDLTQRLSNLHAGKSTFMALPSDVHEGTQASRQYDVKLAGLEGAPSTIKTAEIIEQRHKAILNCFAAGFLILGQSGQGGSFALGTVQKTIHRSVLENKIEYYQDVFNKELIPQLLSLNNIYLSEDDMPRLQAGKVEDADIDNISKMVQRAAAVAFLPRTPAMVNEILEKLDFEYRVPDDMTTEELNALMPQYQSGAGEGMVAGMPNGTSYKVSGKDSTTSNKEAT